MVPNGDIKKIGIDCESINFNFVEVVGLLCFVKQKDAYEIEM